MHLGSPVFFLQAFGRPVCNMKKFEIGVLSDLRKLKHCVGARMEESKVCSFQWLICMFSGVLPCRFIFIPIFFHHSNVNSADIRKIVFIDRAPC